MHFFLAILLDYIALLRVILKHISSRQDPQVRPNAGFIFVKKMFNHIFNRASTVFSMYAMSSLNIYLLGTPSTRKSQVNADEGGSSSKPDLATRFVLFREPVVCLVEYPDGDIGCTTRNIERRLVLIEIVQLAIVKAILSLPVILACFYPRSSYTFEVWRKLLPHGHFRPFIYTFSYSGCTFFIILLRL